MKTSKEIKTATFCVTGLRTNHKTIGSIEYIDLYDLSQTISDDMVDGKIPCATVFITLPDGKTYKWEPGVAHYVYTKGRMSEEEFIDYTFLLTKEEFEAKWLTQEVKEVQQ